MDLAVLAGEELHDAAMAKKSTAGRLDGWDVVFALSLFLGLLDLPQFFGKSKLRVDGLRVSSMRIS